MEIWLWHLVRIQSFGYGARLLRPARRYKSSAARRVHDVAAWNLPGTRDLQESPEFNEIFNRKALGSAQA